MAWLSTKDGRHFNTDWIDEDVKKKKEQITVSKNEADIRNNGNRNIEKQVVSAKDFGKSGIYKVFRAGDIFESPLGFLSFALDPKQSEAYSKQKSMPIESYEVTIKNPLVVTGSDFDDIQEEIAKKFAGRSYTTGSTLKEQQAIMKEAADKIAEQGYDSILMDNINRLSGTHKYEIGLLNSKRNQAKRK